MAVRLALTGREWELIELVLPGRDGSGGRTGRDNGVWFLLASGLSDVDRG